MRRFLGELTKEMEIFPRSLSILYEEEDGDVDEEEEEEEDDEENARGKGEVQEEQLQGVVEE